MIAKNCSGIVVTPLILSIILILFDFILLSILSFIFFIFFLFFFRDPHREIMEGIVSPADGIVMESGRKVAIFMNLWNVHVNRAPVSGKIMEMKHTPGKHSPAFREKGENERLSIKMDTEIGTVKVVQIAGIIARRIVPYVKEGDKIKKGEKIGIVRFGSKVEVYLPDNVRVVVEQGDKIKAGQTIGMYK
ncbi:MAG: phosphatidylserine decarboxylase family protein [Thermoplasmata archaeon]|nr:MAG: phosphatidylserine decarboxylase family protein [Thermoplasmata archaeon]